MNKSMIIVLAMALLALPGSAEEQNNMLVGVPNPAASYCEGLGYEYDNESCIFPDGTECPAWDFYRGKCGQGFTYCEQQGHRIENRIENVSTWTAEYAVCVFDDGSECSEQDYFEGSCSPSECKNWSISDGCVAGDGVGFKGLISKEALVKDSGGKSAQDILGWYYTYRADDGCCYRFYAAQLPSIGMTQPQQVHCPLGVRAFDRYQVDFSQAIEIMHSMNCGDTFVDMALSWPLAPNSTEPVWHIRTALGNDLIIGANTGMSECHQV
jgi:putative hemolysin